MSTVRLMFEELMAAYRGERWAVLAVGLRRRGHDGLADLMARAGSILKLP
jgi:hypothetical protein